MRSKLPLIYAVDLDGRGGRASSIPASESLEQEIRLLPDTGRSALQRSTDHTGTWSVRLK